MKYNIKRENVLVTILISIAFIMLAFVVSLFLPGCTEKPPVDLMTIELPNHHNKPSVRLEDCYECNTNEQVLIADETYFRASMNDEDFEIITYNEAITKLLIDYAFPYKVFKGEDGADQLQFRQADYDEVEEIILDLPSSLYHRKTSSYE